MNGVCCQHQYLVRSLSTREPKVAQNSDHCVKSIVVCIGIKSKDILTSIDCGLRIIQLFICQSVPTAINSNIKTPPAR